MTDEQRAEAEQVYLKMGAIDRPGNETDYHEGLMRGYAAACDAKQEEMEFIIRKFQSEPGSAAAQLEAERARSERMYSQLKAVATFFAKRPEVYDDIKATIAEYEANN